MIRIISFCFCFFLLVNSCYAQGTNSLVYGYYSPYTYYPQSIVYYQPVPVMVPVVQVVPVIPVTTYQNVIVKEPFWCLHHRYKVVSVPQQTYVPINR